MFDGPIRVDANTGWTPDDALALLPELERLGVELIEQPFPARRYDQLRWLQERSSLPIVADESAVTIEDLDALVGVVAGVNVKLAKCGGVGPARRMLERARELGFRTFLGCMEETSIGIAASAAVSPLAEWVDLDGCLLLAEDPVARPGDRARQALAAARRARPGPDAGRRGDALSPQAGAVGAAPVHRGLRGVDKSVGQMVEKPLPRDGVHPIRCRDVAGARTGRGRGADPYRTHPSPAGGRPFIARRPALPPRARRERGPSSMLSASAAGVPTPEAEAFVRFCYQRRRVGWPELYDEMCASRPAACTGGWARTRWRRSAWGSACSRRRGSRSSCARWSPRSRRRGGRPRRR